MDEAITSLTGQYMELIRNDHHKDRDCHFYIYTTWSYGEPPRYSIHHSGYINAIGPEYDSYYDSYKEAESYLFRFLQEIVTDYKESIEEEWGLNSDKSNNRYP